MRSFLTATAIVWPSLAGAFALPSWPVSESSADSRHVASALASTSRKQAFIRFETPCQGCFIGTDDGLVFELTIPRAETECGNVSPLVNGVSLSGPWTQTHGRGHGVLQTTLFNGPGKREIYASWETLCIPEQAQLLSLTIHNIGQDTVKEASGFTVSFKQRGQPSVLRLSGKPTDLASKDISLWHSWVAPSASQRLPVHTPEPDRGVDQILKHHFRPLAVVETNVLRLGGESADLAPEDISLWDSCVAASASQRLPVHTPEPDRGVGQILKHQFHQLAVLQAKAHMLQKAIHDKKAHIEHIIQQDLQSTIHSCPSIKCVLQMTFRKVPKISQWIIDSFRHGRPSPDKIYQSIANQSRSLDKDLEGPNVDLFSVPQPSSPPSDDDKSEWSLPPDNGLPPSLPPGMVSPPPPGMVPPTLSEIGPSPPPGERPPRPDHGRHPLPLPYRHQPHPDYHRHVPKIVKRIVFFIILTSVATIVFRHLRRNTALFRRSPRTADRACRHEERRNRRAHRRAALRHRWSTWWNRYRRPTSPADYDEKRNLILQQESILEDAMQGELRALRSAHAIVEEMYDAEEGRSRLYRAANQPGAVPVELDAGSGGSSGERRRRDSGPLSFYNLPPPPQYEEELEGYLTVVDGFQYTPTTSSVDDDTPDSSVVDCSPRASSDTGRTVTTRGEERD